MADPFSTAKSKSVDLYVPSVEACSAFGIQRAGSQKINDKLSFMKGPQFKNVAVTNPESGDSRNAIDEVILEFIGNKPVSIKPKPGADGVVKMEIEQKEIENELFTMRIAPSTTDWLKFNFSHEWSEGDGIMSRILDTISGLVDAASGIVNTAQNVGAGAGNNAPQPRRKVTLDKQDTYQKTDKVSFKIPFILFSAGGAAPGENPIDNWVRDVYAPLLTITAWSHPKRVTGITGSDGKPVEDSIGASVDAKAAEQAKENDTGGIEAPALSFLSSYPGMRVAISEPPSYVRVTHSSGFFQYNVCAITNFSYSFEGPWVKAYTLVNQDSITKQQKQLLDVTIPMVAKCELEIKVIEKMYADDWISMFENSPLLNTTSNGTVKQNGIVSVLKGGGNANKVAARKQAEKDNYPSTQ
jgi:hypothetical protein